MGTTNSSRFEGLSTEHSSGITKKFTTNYGKFEGTNKITMKYKVKNYTRVDLISCSQIVHKFSDNNVLYHLPDCAHQMTESDIQSCFRSLDSLFNNVCRHQKNEWITPKLPWANIYSKRIFNHPSNFNLKTCIHDDFTQFMSCLGTWGVRKLSTAYNALMWHGPTYIDKKCSLFWVDTWALGV